MGNSGNADASAACDICSYDGDKLQECPSCKMMLCGTATMRMRTISTLKGSATRIGSSQPPLS